MKPVDIIVPVYRGKQELQRCLNSVVQSNPDTPYQLILINDASPEPAVPDFLVAFAHEHPQVMLLHNTENLGFVATVNRGMQLHPERDVLLLNSDTEVANDWLDRIVSCGNSEEDIATVTPFSNNATICSFPEFPQPNTIAAGQTVTSLDLAFKAANPGRHVDIPTGVGFCMWISRNALDNIGYFDEQNFPRGYGEENDFCMRASDHELRNLLCCDTFVFHQGGVSFSDETQALMKNAGKVIDRLHPGYHLLIQEHIALDPARIYRLNVAIQLLHSTEQHKILAITHQMGGGIKKHIQDLGDYLAGQAHFLMILPINEDTIALYLDVNQETQVISFRIPERIDELVELLTYIGIERLHFHHALDIQNEIWALPIMLGLKYDITLHDHYYINGNPAQCDKNGRYCEHLEAQSQPFTLPLPLPEWQALQRQRLTQAARILCPSNFTSELYQRHLGTLEITTVFHPDWEQHAPYPDTSIPAITDTQPLRVLVLGALSMEKGADILEQVAIAATAKKMPLEFHLLGYAYRPLKSVVTEHGAYDHKDVAALVADIAPQLIWFPALIPETFSYTLSEALGTALPVMASDIGAFPQRITGRPLSWLSSWKNTTEQWLTELLQARTVLLAANTERQQQPWLNQPLPEQKFYLSRYLSEHHPASPSTTPVDLDWLAAVFADGAPMPSAHLSRKEAWLRKLFLLRSSRMGRTCARIIPFSVQRAIKRRLSKKPLHEINK